MGHIPDHYIEYIDVDAVPIHPLRVRKQLWNGNQWTETYHYRIPGRVTSRERDWLYETFGAANVYKLGRYWSYSRGGDYTVMDEQVYMMYTLKWSK